MTERKKLVKNLDKAFGDFIKARDNYTCVLCGSKERIQCGHLFTRASYSTRWNELNAHAQCASCNMRHEYDFFPFQNWFVKKFSQQNYEDLYFQHKQVVKYKDWELLDLIDYYKEKLKIKISKGKQR